MYRLTVFLLIVFSVALVAEIVGVIVWRDYQEYGDVAPVRALTNAVWDARNMDGLGAETVSPAPPESVSTDTAALESSLPALKAELLYLINLERVRAQVPPLTFGANPAPQLHAENMMAYGYRSHWDIYGLTPQMRYTLAGGGNRIMQNIAGPLEITGPASDGFSGPARVVSRVHRHFMSLPEGLANVLDPLHRKLNVGLACDGSRCWVVQQFESDEVIFDVLPTIRGNEFEVVGEFREGFELDGVVIWYHPHPRRLSLGQLDATYRYGYGQKPVTFLRPPPAPDRYYPDDVVTYEWDGGIDPYTLEVDLPRSAAAPLQIKVAQSAAVPWTTATRWRQSGQSFSVQADVAPILEKFGAGVYTVQIWGRRGEERAPLTNYTIIVR